MRYQCQRKCLKVAEREAQPTRDLFGSFINPLINKYLSQDNWKAMGLFVNARFEFTNDKFVLEDFRQAGVCVIPSHLEDLVASLLGTTPFKPDFHLKHLDWENYDKWNPHGLELKFALGDVKRYIKQNPKWMEKILLDKHTASQVEDGNGNCTEGMH